MISTFPQSLKAAALKHPKHTAFRCGSTDISYNQLDEKTDQLASHLCSIGVKKGDKVGVYMNRCIETSIAIYGIMKTGAAYVPIDATLPLTRVAYLLNDCEIEHLVSIPLLNRKHSALAAYQTPLKSILGSSAELNIDSTTWDDIFNTSIHNLDEVNIEADDLAYIMYTSGSTGFPKGIMHTHYSGLNYAKLSINHFNLTNDDILANHAPLHFDISTLGYFAGPLACATTVIVTDAHTKMPTSLANLIATEKITLWYSVPLALVQMLQTGILEQLDLSALRLVLFGGEVFTNKYLSELMHLLPKPSFYNIYGPAEVNQCTSYHVKNPPEDKTILPIGKVWEDTDYLIFDKNDQNVADGEIGELLIHSTTRMKGYWNNLELTKKSSYNQTFENSFRIYHRTGDLVRIDDAGELLFMGRNDRQVKIRGYRIEIDEIEACIAQNNEVSEVAVVIVETIEKEKEICAIIIKKENSTLSDKDIKTFCKAQIPVYAVPQRIEFMDSFPRTGSEKIDRNRIIEMLTK
ncbi:amino acid adenylation domain-containing protein [Aurantibacter crassamenti]|uniref:amino acid adenylation domain-containing protein n=1 Tax=Aurantibacter crassamenti TaxID=1837375 RepID=UPI001939ACEB|nr:amino acid adenylation domain-containing protein [Aurantibacter crassamenti]MBM1106803.1 amino acid adenylation domain-containing protein [Aurantibacter crassamenti]